MNEQARPKTTEEPIANPGAYTAKGFWRPLGWVQEQATCYKCGIALQYSTAWVCEKLSIWDRATGRWTKLFCEECYAIVEKASKRLEEAGKFQR